MPVLLLWKRTWLSSEEKDEPPRRVVSMNCSMVYCLTARAGPAVLALFFDATCCARAAPASAVNEISAASRSLKAARGERLLSFMFSSPLWSVHSGLALRDEYHHVAVRATLPVAAGEPRDLFVARAREHAQGCFVLREDVRDEHAQAQDLEAVARAYARGVRAVALTTRLGRADECAGDGDPVPVVYLVYPAQPDVLARQRLDGEDDFTRVLPRRGRHLFDPL